MFGLMGVAPELSPWFFGNNFVGIEKLIIISSLIILAISWSNVLGMQLLVPLNKTKEFTISVTSGAIINFILNLVLIKKFGAIGSCISTIIAEFTVTLVQFYLIKDFIKAKELIKPVVLFIPASIVMYIFVRIIGDFKGAGILTNIVQGMVGVISYFIIIEGLYRILKKQSIITYMKGLMEY